MKIVIDAGHGGSDPGAIDGIDRKGDDKIYKDEIYTEESELNLELALDAAECLSELGHNIFMTRDNDEYISLGERCEIANEVPVDIFISIHANAYKNPNAKGIETFHYPGSKNGKILASKIQNNLILNTSAVNRGIKTNKYLHVLKKTDMPAVLIETGFITNPREEKLLHKKDYQDLIIKSIINGVEEYEEFD